MSFKSNGVTAPVEIVGQTSRCASLSFSVIVFTLIPVRVVNSYIFSRESSEESLSKRKPFLSTSRYAFAMENRISVLSENSLMIKS